MSANIAQFSSFCKASPVNTKQRLIQLVNLVSPGKVIYYGQLGRLLGVSAQVAGWLLSGMPRSEWNQLPWWRVVAKDGYVASLKLGQKGIEQLDLLTLEHIEVVDERVNMNKHLFDLETVVKKDTLL